MYNFFSSIPFQNLNVIKNWMNSLEIELINKIQVSFIKQYFLPWAIFETIRY